MFIKLFKLFKWIKIFLHAHLILLFHYEKKYITGKYFKSSYYNIHAPGWKWIVDDYYACKKIRKNMDVPFPCSPLIKISCPQNIEFNPDDLINFQSEGSYYQAFGKIIIGEGTYIAPNVGLITANHSIDNLDEHESPKNIVLGRHCWIGMNSVILPGVTLGDNTIVGAGAIVTKSFPDGHCILVGNPAKCIKKGDL